MMDERHLGQLEAHLEKLTEGVFARFFARRVHVHDIALQLLRALENGLQASTDADKRPIAPDIYTIHVHSDALRHINTHYPQLDQALSQQIIEIASLSGYRLLQRPQVRFQAAPDLTQAEIDITTTHANPVRSTTAVMQPIKLPEAHEQPQNPQLVISGERSIALAQEIFHIGRSDSCDIVLSDSSVSRKHAQIRLRFGHYTIFDTDSAAGTYVNNVLIREHRLQPGDVIRLGNISMVYLEDDHEADAPTESIDPVL